MIYVKVYLISDSSLSSKPHNKLTTKVTIDAMVSVYFKLSSLPIIYVVSPVALINPIPPKTDKRLEDLPCEEDST